MNKNLPGLSRSFAQPFLTIFFVPILLVLSSVRLHAQTTLAQGDISIIGFSSNGPGRGVSFVTWVPMSAGTVIRFTDDGFNSIAPSTTTGNIRALEQIVTWTASNAIPAGSVVCIWDNTVTASTGTVSIVNSDGTPTSTWSLSNGFGDEIFAFQGAAPATGASSTFTGTILAGLGFQAQTGAYSGWLLTGPATSPYSCLPIDLSTLNTIYVAGNATGGQYTGPRGTGLSNAAYKLLINDVANWTNSTSNTVITNYNLATFAPSLPSIVTQPVNTAVCVGGTATFSVTANAVTGYQWQVDGGIGFLNVVNLPPYSGATTSTLTITGATGLLNGSRFRCVLTGSGTVVSNAGTLTTSLIATTGSQTNISCNGGSNGIATVIASGGISPYSYSWTPSGGTNATATGLTAGAYSVAITDAAGCQGTRNYTIVQPTAMNASTAQTNLACNGGTNGNAGIVVGGGVFPYTYSWSPSGGTANIATGLAAGAYTVTATDANGCTLSRNYTLTQPTALSATTSQTNLSCNGGFNGTASVSVTGGTPPYAYAWSGLGGFSATTTGRPAGTYTVLITDANGCTLTKTVSITQPAAIVLTPSQVNVTCFDNSNGSASVSATGGTGSYTYSWSPSGGTAATATGLSAGFYTVTVTDANSCQATTGYTILQALPLSASTLHTDVSCTGTFSGNASAVVLGGAAPYTYSWSPAGGTGAIATNLATGSYTVTVTDAFGCSVNATAVVGQTTLIAATSSQTNVSCNGGANGTATVSPTSGVPPFTYLWAHGGTSATATGLAAGNYSVTITSAAGCNVVKNFTITEPAPLTVTASATAQSICSGASTDITLSSAVGGTGFSWTAATVSGSVSGAVSGNGSSIAQELSGEGIVQYTITPSDGVCTGTSLLVNVTVNPATAINAQPLNASVNQFASTTFSVTASNATGYQWQVNQGNGYVNLTDVAPYSNTNTSTLTIGSASGSLNGYVYRCVVTGDCAPVTSNGATLSVEVKVPQSITFAHTRTVIYGTPDFNPGAVSSAGLQVFYSSSNEDVATIENGLIHLKAAGVTTIISYQPGNNSFEPAIPMEQILTVSPKSIILTLNMAPAITRPYDGTTHASLVASNIMLQGLVNNDDVFATATATYDTKNVGAGKTVTATAFILNGESAGNYIVSTTSATVSGSITKKQVFISVASGLVITKTYDGTTSVSLGASAFDMSGFGSDDITITGVANFDTKNAGYDKPITVTNLQLAGEDRDNYEVITDVEVITAGDITPKQISLSFNANAAISKVYDGNADVIFAANSFNLDTTIAGDSVSALAIASYNDRNAGAGKPIAIHEIALAGADKDNYVLINTLDSATGAITRKSLEVTLVSEPAVTKQYDGTADATLAEGNLVMEGAIGNDLVSLSIPTVASYDNASAGEHKLVIVTGLEISGDDAGNYQLDTAIVQAPIGIITTKEIIVKALAQAKIYGQADPILTYSVEGLIEGDVLPGALAREAGRNVGLYEIAIGSLNGGNNYVISSFTSDTLAITPADLLIKADSKTRRPQSANPVFTFTYDGLVGSNAAAELTALPHATTTAVSLSPIGDYPIVASGAVSSNYNISYGEGTLLITTAGDDDFTVRTWNSNPDMLELRIYSAIPQNSTIMLYSRHGQEVILETKMLSSGVNSYSMPVNKLAPGIYILAVRANQHRWGQQIRIK